MVWVTLGWDPDSTRVHEIVQLYAPKEKIFSFINICHFTPYPLLKLPFPLNDWCIFAMEQQRNSGLVWSGLELYRTYMWVPLPSYGSLRLNVGIFSHQKKFFPAGCLLKCCSRCVLIFPATLYFEEKGEEKEGSKEEQVYFWLGYVLSPQLIPFC